MITIDGIQYDVKIIDFNRSAEFLDKFAQRTESGSLERELIGVYYNYELGIGSSTSNPSAYDAFWDKITEPVEFHTVTLPTNTGTTTFKAYISNVKDKMFKYKASRGYFKGLSVKFIAQSPSRK